VTAPGDLRLKTAPPGEDVPGGRLEEGRIVTLFSRRYGCTLKVRLDHLRDEELGGHLVADPGHPMFGLGDHLHFRRIHVLDVLGDS